MNSFYDISLEKELPEGSLQLRNLGVQQIFMTTGRRTRGDWGIDTGYEQQNYYSPVTSEDYDRLFISKLTKTKPSYTIDTLLNYHLNYYINSGGTKELFLKHMRYEVLSLLKRSKSYEVYLELFENWIESQNIKPEEQKSTVNTISIGNVYAPLQFQQSSNHSIQNQHNALTKNQLEELFHLIKKDLENIRTPIREEVLEEIKKTETNAKQGRDINSRLVTIGNLLKEIGIGLFTNLASAPIYDYTKPILGI